MGIKQYIIDFGRWKYSIEQQASSIMTLVKEIEICLRILISTLHSIMNTIERLYVSS